MVVVTLALATDDRVHHRHATTRREPESSRQWFGWVLCRESQDGALQAHVQSWHDVVRLILRLISNILIVAIIFVSSRLTDRSPD